MFGFFRFLHILGVAMFFGSVLAHVTAGFIPGAADNPPVMLAVREAISLANWYVTLPGLALAFVSGAFMAATTQYQKRGPLGMHIAGAAAIVAIAAIVLIPAALELQAAAKAVGTATMTPEAFPQALKREYLFGALNILIAVAVIGLGVRLPGLRKDKPCQS